MRKAITLSFMAAAAVLSGCGYDLDRLIEKRRDAQSGAPSCPQLEPGCGANPIPAPGCYATCTTDADCGSGEVCEARSINPCAGGDGEATCTACGATVNLCMPSANPPPPPSCTEYQPGCGSDPIPAAGCYETCSTDADCGSGEACEARSINPCVDDGSGNAVCDACGMTVNVCIKSAQQPPPPPSCTEYQPGCGSNPIPAAGCYVSCNTDADCGSGQACESRSINPCVDDGGGNAVCDACGMTVNVCVASTQQPPPSCTNYEPGCGSNPIPAAGCYETCTTDSDCSGGKQCHQRSINPCPASPNGGATCAACGMEVGVCL